ncbi:FAD:protein FMN transferase [Kordiimonas sp. 5E331]|nr:FAD:protein FMN transferase [Kordiimonas laminariae]MCK0069145.1 FAD:protein FMN transferase [Kordiimonas laminariae]
MPNPQKCVCNQVTKSRPLFGKVARITVVGKGNACASRIIDSVFNTIERFDEITSQTHLRQRFLEISHTSLDEYVPVPSLLRHVLQVANDISYRTDGIFDVAAAGTDGVAEWTDIDLSERRQIRLLRPLSISLDGIRKGFAVDLAIQALLELGANAGLVDIGGCIRTFGSREWRVEFNPEVRTGCQQSSVIPVSLNKAALVGLGAYFGGSKLYDYRRRQLRSSGEWLDASLLVRARSCAVADALTKVAALQPHESEKMLAQFGAKAVKLSAAGVSQLAT